jgi:hypothetical protein
MPNDRFTRPAGLDGLRHNHPAHRRIDLPRNKRRLGREAKRKILAAKICRVGQAGYGE